MHEMKNRTVPSSFLEKFEQPSHWYSTRFSSGDYRKPQIKLRKCRFRISFRGPTIWNDLVESTGKEIQSPSISKVKTKNKFAVLKIQFWSLNYTAVTRIRRNFKQFFISIQVIQGNYSVQM